VKRSGQESLIPLVTRPCFRSSPLTENLEQASVCGLFFFTVVVVASLHRGKYRFERSDGSTFETPIPPFALDSREEDTPDSSGKT